MEEMAAFFDRRVAEYDEHMRTEVDGGDELYAQTAACFAPMEGLRLLDLGCGTGLELEPLFARIPSMKVTGIDLSEGMTNALLQKFPDRGVVIGWRITSPVRWGKGALMPPFRWNRCITLPANRKPHSIKRCFVRSHRTDILWSATILHRMRRMKKPAGRNMNEIFYKKRMLPATIIWIPPTPSNMKSSGSGGAVLPTSRCCGKRDGPFC